MHRGYTAERYLDPSGRGPPEHPRPRGHDRPHRRVPRRDRRRLRGDPRRRRRRRLRRRLHLRVLAPARHPRRRDGRPVRPRRGHPGPDATPHRGRRTPRPGPQPGPPRAGRGDARRRALEDETPAGSAAAPARTSSSTPRPPPHLGPGDYTRARVTDAAPHWLTRRPGRRGSPSRPAERGRRRRSDHLALVGPTASGKSALALGVAAALGDVEIVSLDSMQVYRGLDVGTAKPTAAQRRSVRHHLVDVADPDGGLVGGPHPAGRTGRGRRHRDARAPGAPRRRDRPLRAGRRRRPADPRRGPHVARRAGSPNPPARAEWPARTPSSPPSTPTPRPASSPATAGASCARSR